MTTVYHKIALASNEPKIFVNRLISIESQPIKVVFVVVVSVVAVEAIVLDVVFCCCFGGACCCCYCYC